MTMGKIYAGKLSSGGYISEIVYFTAPGQRVVVIDKKYTTPVVYEVRADEVVENVMAISFRTLGERMFKRANPLPEYTYVCAMGRIMDSHGLGQVIDALASCEYPDGKINHIDPDNVREAAIFMAQECRRGER